MKPPFIAHLSDENPPLSIIVRSLDTERVSKWSFHRWMNGQWKEVLNWPEHLFDDSKWLVKDSRLFTDNPPTRRSACWHKFKLIVLLSTPPGIQTTWYPPSARSHSHSQIIINNSMTRLVCGVKLMVSPNLLRNIESVGARQVPICLSMPKKPTDHRPLTWHKLIFFECLQLIAEDFFSVSYIIGPSPLSCRRVGALFSSIIEWNWCVVWWRAWRSRLPTRHTHH